MRGESLDARRTGLGEYSSIGVIGKIKIKNSQRQQLLEESDLFHPYTSNQKFENFVNDILDLELTKEQT